MNEILCSLTSHTKLERDRGLEKLKLHLKTEPCEGIFGLLLNLNSKPLLSSPDGSVSFGESNPGSNLPWEQIHGCLNALAALFIVKPDILTADVMDQCLVVCHDRLFHPENRIRVSAGELLGRMGAVRGVEVYIRSRELIINGILSGLNRQTEIEESIKEKLNGSSPETVFHDTAGWGNLETNMKALESIIKAVGPDFDGHINEDLLVIVFAALEHTNRFVRESGYNVCGALVSIHPAGEISTNRGQVWTQGRVFCSYLKRGLADNWSQVRMAACVATRHFLLGIPEVGRPEYFPELLPPLCLNRYYIAEGVRLHCQATWRMLFNVSGVKAVEENLAHIVPFYLAQAEADNHAVREAACACIAELATKVGTDPVKVFVPDLIAGLLVCFEDDSWPVRDSACVACGSFVSAFPVECEPYVDRLMPLFYMNLEDNIPSVRQGAGIAIASVIKAYTENESRVTAVLESLSQKLGAVDIQPDTSEQFSELSKNPAQFGVVRPDGDPDDARHTDQVMYSCGSLAPKMGRGGGKAPGAGGCSASHHFKRPTEAWETTDGAVWLYVSLCDVPVCRERLVKMLPVVAGATRKRSYTHHKNLLETIYKTLPMVCRKLTKNKVKPYLNDFLEGLHYGLKSDVHLLRAASVECLQSLSLLLGPNILSGRIEMTDLAMYEYVKGAFPETIGC